MNSIVRAVAASSKWRGIQNPNYEKINDSFQVCETYLNIAGNIPLISSVSGLIREDLGLVQMITGLSLALFHAISAYFATAPESEEKCVQQAKIDVAYFRHGVANICRTQLEQAMLVHVFVARIAYDLLGIRLEYPDVPGCLRASMQHN